MEKDLERKHVKSLLDPVVGQCQRPLDQPGTICRARGPSVLKRFAIHQSRISHVRIFAPVLLALHRRNVSCGLGVGLSNAAIRITFPQFSVDRIISLVVRRRLCLNFCSVFRMKLRSDHGALLEDLHQHRYVQEEAGRRFHRPSSHHCGPPARAKS